MVSNFLEEILAHKGLHRRNFIGFFPINYFVGWAAIK